LEGFNQRFTSHSPLGLCKFAAGLLPELLGNQHYQWREKSDCRLRSDGPLSAITAGPAAYLADTFLTAKVTFAGSGPAALLPDAGSFSAAVPADFLLLGSLHVK